MIGHRRYSHYLSSCEIKAWKKSGLNGIRTQLNYHAIWELVALWVRNIPVECEEYKWYMKDQIFEL